MSAFAWSHNAYYHRLLVRQLPAACRRVLDVGCGTGAFAAELADRVQHVDALDRSPEMIDRARRAVPGNVTCLLGDVLEYDLPAEGYDVIVSVTALHHLPLEDALPVLARTLRPGGVLAAVVLPRFDPRELPLEIAAIVGHRLLAVVFALLRALTGRPWFGAPDDPAMPIVSDPPLTTRQARRVAEAALPGVRVRRVVFWRYLLVWHKPA
ncbi:class I SAM-dependent methyltransferase [Nocardia blacklockiae]|uniref:class I SAM-dependent methyltransferase n=1 Tax=Nocardia blacklockiae TaxID=480036 RepID=UPI00189495F7|nr:class I SAM-dependent methyltransferase [Nocardia blacklockiae]MBF6172623.1 class I SAM-dependent methyltransferase [Nocardia blacklockiae]